MKALRNAATLSVIGLTVLALIALFLSALALTRFRGQEAAPAPAPVASPSRSASATSPASSAPVSSAPASSAPASSPTAVASPSPTSTIPSSDPAQSGPSVVVIGDSFSIGDPSDIWVGTAADELGWGPVTNLSSPGRGYITAPRSCDFEPCLDFPGSIAMVADLEPDIVVTFGGTADGDYDLAEPAAAYFDALRQALPSAELVAISPITTDGSAEYWLTLHRRTIRAGVEAVDGIFVDVGQPGLGDGETLSPEAHAEIAERVVGQLG